MTKDPDVILPGAVAAIFRIQHIVHQKTPGTEPAIHHWQRDFDEIRAICERVVGPYRRQDEDQPSG